jgi:hypothetical protein
MVHVAGLEPRIDHDPVLGTRIVALEEGSLAVEIYGADRTFDRVVVELDATIIEKAREGFPALEDTVHGTGEVAMPRGRCTGNRLSAERLRLFDDIGSASFPVTAC